GLHEEAVTEHRVPGQLRRDQLQRDVPLQPRVVRPVDQPHPTTADQSLDPVPEERRPDTGVCGDGHALPPFGRDNIAVRLYGELADWFHLLTAPEDYAEEAEFARELLVQTAEGPVRTVLELGSGGGNNASHLKATFELALVDVSPTMLDLS